jgi:hypothetical protein
MPSFSVAVVTFSLRTPNPIACRKVNHEVPIQAARLPIVDVFYACRKTQLGSLEQASQSPVLPACPFQVPLVATAFNHPPKIILLTGVQ